MRSGNKELDAAYKTMRLEQGYVRINTWCPKENKVHVEAIIDLLSCHKEDSGSTVEFHEFIDDFIYNANKIIREYEVHNDK
jgi:hypothetical protein